MSKCTIIDVNNERPDISAVPDSNIPAPCEPAPPAVAPCDPAPPVVSVTIPPVSATPPVSAAPPASATVPPVAAIPPVSAVPPVSAAPLVAAVPPVSVAPLVAAVPPVSAAPPAATVPPPADSRPKVKHDWYQTETHVVITILLKGVEQDKVVVEYGENHLTFTCPIPKCEDGQLYTLQLDLLHPVESSQCSHKTTASKVEVKLKKKEGVRWDKLEGEKRVTQALQSVKIPKYPSSSPANRDWDKIEKEIIKQEEAEKPEGEDALKKLFEQIYGSGSDEVKKAMNKSFMESKGTVLSTNWNEVAKDKVDMKPPDGIEFKEWDG